MSDQEKNGYACNNSRGNALGETKSANLVAQTGQWLLPWCAIPSILDWNKATVPVTSLTYRVTEIDEPFPSGLDFFRTRLNDEVLQLLCQGGALQLRIVKCTNALARAYLKSDVFLIVGHAATGDSDTLQIELQPTFAAIRHIRDRERGVLQQQFDTDSQIDDEEAQKKCDEGREKLDDELAQKIQDELPEVFLHPFADEILAKTAGNSARLAAWIEDRLNDERLPLATDGRYEVRVLPGCHPKLSDERFLLVTYSQREPRALIDDWRDNLRTHPDMFRQPLLTGTSLPPSIAIEGHSVPTSFDRILDDLHVPEGQDARNEAALRIRSVVAESGSEALAWYQSLHDYDVHSWGIYLHYERLGYLAADLGQHLSDRRHIVGDRLLKEFVIGAIREHELFHAKIDCFAVAQELLAGRALAVPYKTEVYQAVSMTPGWLEEALANHSAWQGARELADGWVQQKRWSKEARNEAMQFLEDLFALSPPGYSNWELGHDFMTSRRLLAQLAEGTPSPHEPLSRLEDVFSGFCRTTFLEIEVPHYWWTEDTGKLDRLFNTPSRREVVRFLERKGYVHKRTSGSHFVYEGPDGKCFSLPKRDPLSLAVFSSFRHHFGISKHEYLAMRVEM